MPIDKDSLSHFGLKGGGQRPARASPEDLAAWRSGLLDRLREAALAEGLSEEEFNASFGEIAKTATSD